MTRALMEYRLFIRAQWERLLRLGHGDSPLGRPDALIHLLDTTLDEIYRTLADWSPRRRPSRQPEPVCPCGGNPFPGYFSAGRQALNEGLVTIQSRMPALTAARRDEAFACLNEVFSHVARREIELFCSLCQLHSVKRLRAGDAARFRPTRPALASRDTSSGIRRRSAGTPG